MLALKSVTAFALLVLVLASCDVSEEPSDEGPASTPTIEARTYPADPTRWVVTLAAGVAPDIDIDPSQAHVEHPTPLPPRDGPAREAIFAYPVGLAFDSEGNLLIADPDNLRIRRLRPDATVETYAGSGEEGGADGHRLTASFRSPVHVAVGPDGTVYVVDSVASVIRAITVAGEVTTVAGVDAFLCDAPSRLKVDETPEVEVPDACPEPGEERFRDGPAATALFSAPASVAVDGEGNLYVADAGNNRIRRITPDGVVSTFAGSGQAGHRDGPPHLAQFFFPVDLAFAPDGNLYVTSGSAVRVVAPDGTVSTVVGTDDLFGGFSDGPAATAEFTNPTGLAVAPDGTIFVVDSGNQRVRMIDIAGNVTTIAGIGGQAFSLSLGRGDRVQLGYPLDIELAPDGDLYLVDRNLQVVLRLSPCEPGDCPE